MNGAFYVFLLVVFLYGITLLMMRFATGQWALLRRPVTWFYASWLVGLALLCLPLFEYYESFGLDSAVYFIGIFTAFSAGAVGAAFRGRETAARAAADGAVVVPRVFTDLRRLTYLLLLAGFAGTMLLMTNTILSGELTIGERLNVDNAAAVRYEHMAPREVKIGPLYGLANFLSSIGGIGVALFMYALGARERNVPRFARYGAYLVLALNCVAATFAFGSRMFAVFSLTLALLAFVQGRWAIGERLFMRRPTFRGAFIFSVMSVLTAGSLWLAATWFLEKRVASQSPSALLYRTHRANFSQDLHELIRQDRPLQYFFFSVSYLTTSVPTLVFYLDLPENRLPGPYFGEYNFPAVARWSRRLTFSASPFSWEYARYEIFKPLAEINFGTNVWPSMVRDLIADFGRLGALAFLFALGYFSQRLTNSQERSPRPIKAVLLIYVQLVLWFAGLVSVLFMPQIHWPLYVAALLAYLAYRREVRSEKARVEALDRRVRVAPGRLAGAG